MIRFVGVTCPPFQNLSLHVPDGTVIGLVGRRETAQTLLRVAAGVLPVDAGTVEFRGPRLLLHPDDIFHGQDGRLLLMDQTLSRCDALEKAQACALLSERRRQGGTLLVYSHDEPLLAEICDEVWWLSEKGLVTQGDPDHVLAEYRAYVSARRREIGAGQPSVVSKHARRGDGRAAITALRLCGALGTPVATLESGEEAEIQLGIRFAAAVDDPVAGILIRTRVGLNVYGTNTELERLKWGPRRAGDEALVHFRFRADLCPGEYTLTAASHDPDGTWHEWLEDAIAFSVTDARYTAGVANLRARVWVG